MFDLRAILVGIKKKFSRADILFLGLLVVLYFLTRLVNLDKFPIFSDEGIYIHWAKIAWHDATWRFISLTDGKQPLQTWGTIPFLKLFPNNALLAGRLFAVSTGFAALVGVYLLLYQLFGKKSAYLGSLFYVFTPYFLFYDRMALVDSGVNAGFIWLFFFSILIIRTLRLDLALLYGLIGGISLLAKSSVQMFIGLGLFAPILSYQKNIKKFKWTLLNYLFLYIIGVVIAFVLYNVQRLSPFLHFVAVKNTTFVMTFREFLHTPFAYVFNNLSAIPLYVFWEGAVVLPFLGLIGLYLIAKKDWRLFVYFLIWIVLPFTAIAFFAKVLFPRYVIFFATLLLISAAYFLSQVKNKSHFILLCVLYIISISYFNYTILFDYRNIPFPPIDRGQYLEGWPAGWGAKEIVEFAREKSQQKPVILIAEGNFGMAGDVLDVFVHQGDKITIKGYWPLEEPILRENQKFLKDNLIYVVFPHRTDFPISWPVKLIKAYDKPGNQSKILLYELTQ